MLPSGPQLGGAPANFAYHAAALGARAMMVTRVGEDDLGSEVLRRFRRANLSSETLQIDPTRPTGTVSVTLDEKGIARYTFSDEAAWDALAATEAAREAVRRAHALCFGTLAQRSSVSRKTVQQLLAAAPTNALKIFDVNLRLHFYSREVVEESMHLANVLKMNDEELSVMTALFSLQGDVRQRIEALVRAFGFKVVALTRGASGSLVHQDGQWSELFAHSDQFVDTVGAGDAFAAALAMGLLVHMPLRETHYIAAKLASYVCSQHGATPPLPPGFREKFQDEVGSRMTMRR